MILETLRSLADALSPGGSTPLGTQLAAVPRDAGDPLPSTPTVLDGSRSFDAAIGKAPDNALPALTICFDEVADMDNMTVQQTKDAGVAVLFRYVDRDSNAATAVRDALYVMRALERCLDRLPYPIARNGIQLYTCSDRRYLALPKMVEDQWQIIGLRCVFDTRDTTP